MKQGLIGNCHLFNVNGNSVSDGAMVMHGINTLFPLLTPLAISTSKTLSPSFDMISCVPFLSPFPEPAQRFLNKITGAPTLSAMNVEAFLKV